MKATSNAENWQLRPPAHRLHPALSLARQAALMTLQLERDISLLHALMSFLKRYLVFVFQNHVHLSTDFRKGGCSQIDCVSFVFVLSDHSDICESVSKVILSSCLI